MSQTKKQRNNKQFVKFYLTALLRQAEVSQFFMSVNF
jgi:hypothetical protein